MCLVLQAIQYHSCIVYTKHSTAQRHAPITGLVQVLSMSRCTISYELRQLLSPTPYCTILVDSRLHYAMKYTSEAKHNLYYYYRLESQEIKNVY